jgi:hypothetical protein
VISKRHCPHIGVVNFFIAAEPFIAVGSVSEEAAPNRAGGGRIGAGVQVAGRGWAGTQLHRNYAP